MSRLPRRRYRRHLSRRRAWWVVHVLLCALAASCESVQDTAASDPGGARTGGPAGATADRAERGIGTRSTIAKVVPATASTESTVSHAGDAGEGRPLTGLDSEHTSAESLSRAVLKALKERDEGELTRLRVTYREYRDLLFPHLDTARPPRNISVEFNWKLLNTKSILGAREALQGFGGREFELLEVLPQGVDEYPTFRVLRKVRLRLRRVSDGAVDTVTIFGSIVEMDSRYKLLSFPS